MVISIIAIVEMAVYTSFQVSNSALRQARSRIAAVALANEKMEILRNLPYDSLATEHGPIYPSGNILDNENLVRSGRNLRVNTIITYVDDPYDGNAAGTIVGKPKDIYPFDYKKIEIAVYGVGKTAVLAKITSNVSAKAAETPSNTGIVKICVVDALSLPVIGATVTISNPNPNPKVDITGLTGNGGCIMVPNLPPSSHNEYHITATKAGFSMDMTYPRTAQNPNAIHPDVDVLAQQVTSKVLIIDRVSMMNIQVKDRLGGNIATSLHIEGLKLKYNTPITPIYSQDIATGVDGKVTVSSLEFDGYTISASGYNIITTKPYQPVSLMAGTALDVVITVSNSGSWPQIKSVTPNTGKVGDTVNMTIEGENFNSGLTVKLVKGANQIVGTDISVTGHKNIDVKLNLTNAEVGIWDLVVTNPDGSEVIQEGGFSVSGT